MMSQNKTANQIIDLLTTQLAIPEPNIMVTQDHQGIPWLIVEAVNEGRVPTDSPWYVNKDINCYGIMLYQVLQTPKRYINYIHDVWPDRFVAPAPRIWSGYQAPLSQVLLEQFTHGSQTKTHKTPTWLMGNRDDKFLWQAILTQNGFMYSNPLNGRKRNQKLSQIWDGRAFSIPACQSELSNGQNPLEPWLTYAIGKMQGTIDKFSTFIQNNNNATNILDIQNATQLIGDLKETEETLKNNQCTSGSTTTFEWLTSDDGEIFFIPNNKLTKRKYYPIIIIKANKNDKENINNILNQLSGVKTKSIIDQKDGNLYQIVTPTRNQDSTTDFEQLYATLRFLLDHQKVQTTIDLKNAEQFDNRDDFVEFVKATQTSIRIPEPYHETMPFWAAEDQLNRCRELQEMFKTASFSR